MKTARAVASLAALLAVAAAGTGCAVLFAPEQSCERYETAAGREACRMVDAGANACGERGVKSVKVTVGPSVSEDGSQVDAGTTTEVTCRSEPI